MHFSLEEGKKDYCGCKPAILSYTELLPSKSAELNGLDFSNSAWDCTTGVQASLYVAGGVFGYSLGYRATHLKYRHINPSQTVEGKTLERC